MGHTRLGPLPKSRSWNQVVETLTGSRLRGFPVSSSASRINIIAAQTLKAAKTTLAKASDDPGVRYTFYLLTQLTLASRHPDWRTELDEHGIALSDQSSVFDLVAEVQRAIDRYVGSTSFGATDLSEMAQQAVGEALTSLLAAQIPSLFEDADSNDLKKALRTLSTKKGFGQLGQRFFGRFVARFLNFHLSRVTAAGWALLACKTWDKSQSSTKHSQITVKSALELSAISAATGIPRPNTSTELILRTHLVFWQSPSRNCGANFRGASPEPQSTVRVQWRFCEAV